MIGLKFRGRPPIHFAQSVKDVIALKDEYSHAIMDRNYPITEEFVGAVMAQSVMSWKGRNPASALDESGNFQGTDLDLLSFLVPVVDRGAVIEIPRYRNRRQVVVREGERKIGSSQFGRLTGLISHRDVHSFSVRIYDNTIVAQDSETGKEEIGAHRNYMIVDCDGHWYHGWDRICWNPSAEENRFLAEKGLWTGNTVYFHYYVYPSRWQSVFSAQHLINKMLVARLDDEAAFYRQEMKRLEALGYTLPEGEQPIVYKGKTRPIQVQALKMELDLPEFSGTYAIPPENQEGLVAAYRLQKYLTYTLKPLVQFGVRADEAAYFQFGNGRVANWMRGRTWRPGYKLPGGRTEWNLMTLSSDVALRCRIKTVTQRVSVE